MKLGEEPTRTIIGELAGDYKTESVFLTDLLGRLPAAGGHPQRIWFRKLLAQSA